MEWGTLASIHLYLYACTHMSQQLCGCCMHQRGNESVNYGCVFYPRVEYQCHSKYSTQHLGWVNTTKVEQIQALRKVQHIQAFSCHAAPRKSTAMDCRLIIVVIPIVCTDEWQDWPAQDAPTSAHSGCIFKESEGGQGRKQISCRVQRWAHVLLGFRMRGKGHEQKFSEFWLNSKKWLCLIHPWSYLETAWAWFWPSYSSCLCLSRVWTRWSPEAPPVIWCPRKPLGAWWTPTLWSTRYTFIWPVQQWCFSPAGNLSRTEGAGIWVYSVAGKNKWVRH